MFTGLIQDIGEITELRRSGDDVFLKIKTGCDDIANQALGASIACNGICLTVVEKQESVMSFEASAETISKTTIGDWIEGGYVNLEPSLVMGDSLGGHFVFGHVDGLATLSNVAQNGESWRLRMQPKDQSLMKYIASKGSVSLNGISLTVNGVSDIDFDVNIIPHTWQHTTLQYLNAGDVLNIEIDMLARYVARMMEIA